MEVPPMAHQKCHPWHITLRPVGGSHSPIMSKYGDNLLVVSRYDLINRALRAPLLPQERLVLVCLIQHIRTSGKKKRLTWVKQAQVADELRMPVRNVKRHMDRLEDVGLIQRWRQPHGYLYRIPPSWAEVVCPEYVSASGHGQATGRAGFSIR